MKHLLKKILKKIDKILFFEIFGSESLCTDIIKVMGTIFKPARSAA